MAAQLGVMHAFFLLSASWIMLSEVLTVQGWELTESPHALSGPRGRSWVQSTYEMCWIPLFTRTKHCMQVLEPAGKPLSTRSAGWCRSLQQVILAQLRLSLHDDPVDDDARIASRALLGPYFTTWKAALSSAPHVTRVLRGTPSCWISPPLPLSHRKLQGCSGPVGFPMYRQVLPTVRASCGGVPLSLYRHL